MDTQICLQQAFWGQFGGQAEYGQPETYHMSQSPERYGASQSESPGTQVWNSPSHGNFERAQSHAGPGASQVSMNSEGVTTWLDMTGNQQEVAKRMWANGEPTPASQVRMAPKLILARVGNTVELYDRSKWSVQGVLNATLNRGKGGPGR